VLLLVGVVVNLYGELRFLVVADNRNLWWFFGCLFVPFVSLFFVLLNLRLTLKPFALSCLGFLVTGLGCWLARESLAALY
jgi:hypothetical protein